MLRPTEPLRLSQMTAEHRSLICRRNVVMLHEHYAMYLNFLNLNSV